MTKRRTSQKQANLSKYFENMARLFWNSEFYFYYAYCYYKHYLIYYKYSAGQEHLSIKASKVLLGLICSSTRNKKSTNYWLKKKLEKLITTSDQMTSLESIISQIVHKRIGQKASPEVEQLFDYFFNNFELFEFQEKVKPLLQKIGEDPELAPFIKQLEQALIFKTLQECSNLYTTIKMSKLKKILSFLSFDDCMTMITQSLDNKSLNIVIDQRNKIVKFNND